jgi:hypothetical protein
MLTLDRSVQIYQNWHNAAVTVTLFEKRSLASLFHISREPQHWIDWSSSRIDFTVTSIGMQS